MGKMLRHRNIVEYMLVEVAHKLALVGMALVDMLAHRLALVAGMVLVGMLAHILVHTVLVGIQVHRVLELHMVLQH